MKKDLLELVFILDRSGSMAGLEQDTIGGFQSMMERQKKKPGDVLVSTILFDDRCQVLHDRVPLSQVAPMTEEDYWVRGCTALLDAIGGAVRHIGNIHRYARPEDVPEKTMFVITTDGMENASRRYSVSQVREMIREKQENQGWEFLFLGANIDAIQTAERFGIREDRAVNFHCDPLGTALNYQAIGDAVSTVREHCPLGRSWKADIDRDFHSR